jgi:hypothetical protein
LAFALSLQPQRVLSTRSCSDIRLARLSEIAQHEGCLSLIRSVEVGLHIRAYPPLQDADLVKKHFTWRHLGDYRSTRARAQQSQFLTGTSTCSTRGLWEEMVGSTTIGGWETANERRGESARGQVDDSEALQSRHTTPHAVPLVHLLIGKKPLCK